MPLFKSGTSRRSFVVSLHVHVPGKGRWLAECASCFFLCQTAHRECFCPTGAERVRRIGGTTVRSVSHISELQTLHDDNDEFVPWDRMIHRLLDDNRQMAEAQRAAIEVCEENRDTPTANLLQEILNGTEKRIWFLNETCQS